MVQLIAASVDDTTAIELHRRASTNADSNGLLGSGLLQGVLVVLWYIFVTVNSHGMSAGNQTSAQPCDIKA
jgi:hypothetical protein